MKERYVNWKELKPLTAPVPVGSICVSLCERKNNAGDLLIVRTEKNGLYCCQDQQGNVLSCYTHELALLPSEEPAKAERKIVQIATNGTSNESELFALCNDDTVWVYGSLVSRWLSLPPIPQDAV